MLRLTLLQVNMIREISKYMLSNNYTLSVAESCTGGLISSSFTSQSGASKYFKGGVIAYSDNLKVQLLGINELDILEYGVVSKEIVELMACNAKVRWGVDFSIATTGWMDLSDNQLNQKAWVAICFKGNVTSKYFILKGTRLENMSLILTKALNLLRKAIL
jgi:PncC family amidohydrolase